MVNKAILLGRLGRDPELRYTGSGMAVCNFTIATDESYKDKSGERQKRTEWHSVITWDKLAGVASKYLVKGSMVYVEGRIQTRQWEDREGQKRQKTEIVASTLRMIGSKGGREEDQSQMPKEPEEQSDASEISDDEIPY